MKTKQSLEELTQRCIAPLGTTFFDPHAHECPRCTTIWAHDPIKMHGCTEAQFDRAHTCPKCGAEQTYTYPGKSKPSVMYDGQVTRPLDGCRFEYLPCDRASIDARRIGNPVYEERAEEFSDLDSIIARLLGEQ